MVRLRAGLAAALALLLAGCTIGPSPRPSVAAELPTTAPSTAAPNPTAPNQPAVPLPFRACTDQDITSVPAAFGAAECAQLKVPISYRGSGGQVHIQLHVARLVPTNTDPTTLTPLLVLPGSPGRSSTDDLSTLAQWFPSQVRAKYAIYLMDFRGATQGQHPDDPRFHSTGGYLQCLRPRTLKLLMGSGAAGDLAAGDRAQLDAVARAVAMDCTADDRSLLSAFHPVAVTDDIDTLRASIGAQKITVLGRGYGGAIAALYASRYPSRVERMVLDAPDDFLADRVRVAIDKAIATEIALDNMAANCASTTSRCYSGAHTRQLLNSLLRSRAPLTGSSRLEQLGQMGILLTVATHLPSPSQWQQLSAALAAANQGHGGQLLGLAEQALFTSKDAQAFTAQLAYTCNGSIARPTAGDLREQMAAARKAAPLFGTYFVGALAWCANWPTPASPITELAPSGLGPILVIIGETDPVVPGSASRSLASRLSSARTISWRSSTHGGFPTSGCVSQHVVEYLISGALPERGTLCGA